MKEIIIVIKDEGKISIEAIGYTGNSCKIATEPFEKALGIGIKTEEKSQMYEDEVTQENTYAHN